MSFGKRIREERGRLGLSQSALAEIGRVSKATQIAYEADNSSPSLVYMDRITSVGVDWIYVVSGVRQIDVEMDGINWPLIRELVKDIGVWQREQGVELPEGERIERIEHLRAIYNQRQRESAYRRASVARSLRS